MTAKTRRLRKTEFIPFHDLGKAEFVPFFFALLLLAIGAISFAPATGAHETDQYSVPEGRELVDLGDLWNRLLHEAVRKSVEETNAEIDAVHDLPFAEVRSLRLAALQSPDYVAGRIRRQFPLGLLMIDDFERTLRKEEKKLAGEGKLLLYRAAGESTYEGLLPLPDPRILGRLEPLRASTMRVHGCCFGADKLGHFIGWGHLYYLRYRLSRGVGASEQKSLFDSTQIGNANPIGEIFLHGLLPTGVYSNADLAANYVGLKFYLNLSEPVRLKGELCPPMLQRDGQYWKLASHVRPDGRFFSMFVSDHYDEALNPCLYDWTLRDSVRKNVGEKRDSLVKWYAGGEPEKATRAWFDRRWAELQTYYGEDYGHFGDYHDLVTVGNTCFPGEAASRDLIAGSHGGPSKVQRSVAGAASDSAPVARPVSARLAKAAANRHESDAFRDVRLKTRVVGVDRASLQQSLDFAVEVANASHAPTRELHVDLQLPPGLLPTTIEKTAAYDAQARTLRWRIANLPAGATHRLRYKASTIDTGEQSQTVTVREDNVLLAESESAIEVESSLSRRTILPSPYERSESR
jgi:hypothetical protein